MRRIISPWYTNLKEQVDIDESTIKQKIRDAYKQAIKPLSKSLKILNYELLIKNR